MYVRVARKKGKDILFLHYDKVFRNGNRASRRVELGEVSRILAEGEATGLIASINRFIKSREKPHESDECPQTAWNNDDTLEIDWGETHA